MNRLLGFLIRLVTVSWERLTGRASIEALLKEVKEYNAGQKALAFQAEILTRLRGGDIGRIKEAIVELLRDNNEIAPHIRQVVTDISATHKNTPLLVAALQADVPVWLYGDAGSGKSTAARNAAEALGLQFRFISACPTTTKSELLGYKDANGHYHSTPFREMFENGGVFLIDEIDNGNPSTLAILNEALSNGYCAFPDGNVKKHPNARFVAAANTIGHGADIHYIGRNALDATTLDRFVYIHMGIDENLEGALIGRPFNRKLLTDPGEGGEMNLWHWHKFVLNVRNACHELGLEHLVTPRATIYGRRLIIAGVGKSHLANMCVWKGIRETDKTKILEQMTRSIKESTHA